MSVFSIQYAAKTAIAESELYQGVCPRPSRALFLYYTKAGFYAYYRVKAGLYIII